MRAHLGVIGSGIVGQTLAAGYARHGHRVTIGTRTPKKLEEWASGQPGVEVGEFHDAADTEIVILAVQGGAAAEALRIAGHERLAGKIVIDTCNPIAGPPKDGVIPYFTGPGDSLMQRLQASVEAARFVKAFSSVGNALMIDPTFPGGRPSMFICGDDAAAKATVSTLLDEVGWDVEDVGGAAAAGPVEALCQLWCAPGFLRNDWSHAFKVLRA